jgi:hypothetical protein
MATPGMIEAVRNITELGIEPYDYAVFVGVAPLDMDRWLDSYYEALEEMYPTN